MTNRVKVGLVGALAAVIVVLLGADIASANWGPRTRWHQIHLADTWQRPKKQAGHVPAYFLWTWGTGVVGTPDNGPGQTTIDHDQKPYVPPTLTLEVPGDLPEAPPVVKVDEAGVERVKAEMTTEGQQKLDEAFRALGIRPANAPPP